MILFGGFGFFSFKKHMFNFSCVAVGNKCAFNWCSTDQCRLHT